MNMIEEHNGVKILYTHGSYYEMGHHHGELLKKQICENIRAILNFSTQKGTSYNELLYLWNIMKNHIPKEYMEELNGIADGSDLPFKHIAAANMATVKIAQLTQCSVFAAWGPATSNNKLIHVKSFDYPFIIKDPETGKYIQENQISIVRQPENGFVSVFPSFAGFYGSGGINEKGIGIGILLSHSHDQSYHGIPDRIKIQMILDHADTTNEALDIISANTTMGFNFILSDGQNQK